jgi:hypothetical protein
MGRQPCAKISPISAPSGSKKGTRSPGTHKIAAEFGVSPATVIRGEDQAGVKREIRKRCA